MCYTPRLSFHAETFGGRLDRDLHSERKGVSEANR